MSNNVTPLRDTERKDVNIQAVVAEAKAVPSQHEAMNEENDS